MEKEKNVAQTTTTVKTTRYTDVYEKEQLYIVIKNGENKAIINVGKKTFDKVNAVLNNAPLQENTNNLFDEKGGKK